ncbi:MAG: hypothetical protein KDD47_06065 [Acidobacteria bacterium]|nr:hypothetical protein [Acidobacteriota bacterium]
MRNLTLALDDELLMEARKLAIAEETTVNQMVREFLAGRVLERDRRSTALAAIERSFEDLRIEVGQPGWTREDLHER